MHWQFLSLTACIMIDVNCIPVAAHVRQLAVGLHLKSCDCLRSCLLHKCLVKVVWVILFKPRNGEIDFHTIVRSSFCRSRRISTCSYNDRCSRSTTAESNSCRFINRSIYYAIVSCSFNRPWPAIFASRSISQRRRHLNNRFAVAKRCEKNSLANNSWLLSLPRIELRIFLASKSELRLIIGKLPVESCSEITVSLILFARYKFFFFPVASIPPWSAA